MKLQVAALLLMLVCGRAVATAQAPDGMLSEAEVESLREAAYDPVDRVLAYEKILDTRVKRLNALFANRRHAGREQEAHEIFDQFASIADEFIDNLSDYRKQHRDIRKVLPKLTLQTDQWNATLQAPPPDDAYNIVRKVALDNLRDLYQDVVSLGPDLDAYFKEHPDALKREKDRADPRRSPALQ